MTRTETDNVIRIGTLGELTGKGTEYLLSADRKEVIAVFWNGNFLRAPRQLTQAETQADTVPCAA
jgi:hypothetical protein